MKVFVSTLTFFFLKIDGARLKVVSVLKPKYTVITYSSTKKKMENVLIIGLKISKFKKMFLF